MLSGLADAEENIDYLFTSTHSVSLTPTTTQKSVCLAQLQGLQGCVHAFYLCVNVNAPDGFVLVHSMVYTCTLNLLCADGHHTEKTLMFPWNK